MAPTDCDPLHVDISLSQGIRITWADGHESQYLLDYLRKRCPCANCRNTQDSPAAASPFPMFQPAARLTGAEPVGRYAVQLLWSDGHSTGIYSFQYLREICSCAACQASSAR